MLEQSVLLDGCVPARTAGLSGRDLRGPEKVVLNRTKRSREVFGGIPRTVSPGGIYLSLPPGAYPGCRAIRAPVTVR